MNGVVVIRPTASWNDPESLLFRLVPAVQMHDVAPLQAMERLARALGHGDPLGAIPLGRPLSVDTPAGTVLDLLNAMVRAHGELSWTLEPEEPAAARRSGYPYTLTFGVMGGGGMGVGVR
jgi:hypothetical protein